MKYVWQEARWPTLTYQGGKLLPFLSQARLAQGKLLARVKRLGLTMNREAEGAVLTEEVIQTSAIEGERLDRNSVRSSVAKRLGLPTAGVKPASRSVEGLVEVLLDATQQAERPLTSDRLKRWHAALFPSGQSGLRRIRIGKWRDSAQPMQVVSGPIGREKVHYEAPPSDRVEAEMKQFFSWWKSSRGREDGLIRSGLAHWYFVVIHPFDDGNGRLGRALTDMALAQDEHSSLRAYSFSSQIMDEREKYYEALKSSQRAGGDLTNWLIWYLSCHRRAVEKASRLMEDVLAKSDFWNKHAQVTLNDRQRKVLNRLLDAGQEGFEGGLTTRKYVAMAKVSRATAFREISELLEKYLLRQNPAKGRSVSYDLNWGAVKIN